MTKAVKKINKYLADNERSQTWLAKQLGISKQHLHMILKYGRRPVKVELREKFKKLCGVGDDWV